MSQTEFSLVAPLFRVRRGMAIGFDEQPSPANSRAQWVPTREARALALGYRIRRAVEQGEVESFSAAARLMKVTPQRVSKLVLLTLLPFPVQERMLGAPLAGRDHSSVT